MWKTQDFPRDWHITIGRKVDRANGRIIIPTTQTDMMGKPMATAATIVKIQNLEERNWNSNEFLNDAGVTRCVCVCEC